ncbi:Neurotransmitter-gated ion-channel ligand binding domain protein [Cooperia oncophora]
MTVIQNSHGLSGSGIRSILALSRYPNVGPFTNVQERSNLYINEFWEDPALDFDYMNPCKSNISFDDKVLQKLWIPNTCFINSKNAAIHESPFKNVFLMVFANGTLWTNYRMKLTGPCDMNLKRFPFDQQKCTTITQRREGATCMNQPYPVILLKPIQLPDFEMVNFSVIAVEQVTIPILLGLI